MVNKDNASLTLAKIFARAMLSQKMPVESVAKITKLPLVEVEKLKKAL